MNKLLGILAIVGLGTMIYYQFKESEKQKIKLQK